MGAIEFVAFLRGINVGGRGVVTMADVKKAFESLGFQEVRTLGASGNVSFRGAPSKDLRARIERALGVRVQLRTLAGLRKWVAADPFRGVRVTPNTKKVVTFLDESSAMTIKLPYVDKGTRILSICDSAAFSTYERGSKGATFMTVLEKAFGKSITTRTWDVVLKLSQGD